MGTVPYVELVLAGIAASPPPAGEPIFLHLGLFEDPPGDDRVSAEQFRAAQRTLTERVLEHAAITPGLAILEVGCGFGGNLVLLDANTTGCDIVGLDFNPALLDVARARLSDRGINRVTYVDGDATALPFAPHSFDRVLAVECAFHFASRASFLREAARVLRPGGRVVLTDFVASPDARERSPQLPERLLFALAEDLSPYPDPWCLEGSWPELAERAGLEVDIAIDWTSASLPSFDFIFAGKAPDFTSAPHATDRGAAALDWLLRRGVLRMELAVLTRRLGP